MLPRAAICVAEFSHLLNSSNENFQSLAKNLNKGRQDQRGLAVEQGIIFCDFGA